MLIAGDLGFPFQKTEVFVFVNAEVEPGMPARVTVTSNHLRLMTSSTCIEVNMQSEAGLIRIFDCIELLNLIQKNGVLACF